MELLVLIVQEVAGDAISCVSRELHDIRKRYSSVCIIQGYWREFNVTKIDWVFRKCVRFANLIGYEDEEGGIIDIEELFPAVKDVMNEKWSEEYNTLHLIIMIACLLANLYDECERDELFVERMHFDNMCRIEGIISCCDSLFAVYSTKFKNHVYPYITVCTKVHYASDVCFKDLHWRGVACRDCVRSYISADGTIATTSMMGTCLACLYD